MATKKTQSKKHLTPMQVKTIIKKYYSLKNYLYQIANDTKYYDSTRKIAETATKKLEKWRGDYLDTARMSGFSAS